MDKKLITSRKIWATCVTFDPRTHTLISFVGRYWGWEVQAQEKSRCFSWEAIHRRKYHGRKRRYTVSAPEVVLCFNEPRFEMREVAVSKSRPFSFPRKRLLTSRHHVAGSCRAYISPACYCRYAAFVCYHDLLSSQ